MRIFHELAFHGRLTGTTSVQTYSDPLLSEAMGAVDLLHVGGYATQVTGTAPVLVVYVQFSPDNFFWHIPGGLFVIAKSLSTTGETIFQGVDFNPASTGSKKAQYARLRFHLTGTDPSGIFTIWVTGRDQSRRSRGLRSRGLGQVELAGHSSPPGKGTYSSSGMQK